MKHILKYLKRTGDCMFVYSIGDLGTLGYTDSDFQGDIDYSKIASKKHINCMCLKRVPDFL